MNQQPSHRKTLIIGSIVAGLMFFFSFAIVPVYGVLCKATGISTTVPSDLSKASSSGKPTDLNRSITVQFVATNHKNLPWDFYPRTKSITLHPGESAKVVFFARNNTNKTMTVQAIPGMTPVNAISHFHKIECFCFRQQTLKAGESKDMGLVFQVDNDDLPKDLRTITLAYTLFDVTPKAKNQ